MSNVHLPFVNVYQRMTDFVQTLAYAGVIRNSVTGVLVGKLKPIFSCLAVAQVWLYFLDEFSCEKEQGTVKCLICTML